MAETPPASPALVAGATAPATPNSDTGLTYTAGVLSSLTGNDVITATSTSLQSTLLNGGFINGGAGVDTLKFAPETALNLETLTTNQTVRPVQELEVFEMQGASSLTLSANDVLSLGGTNTGTSSSANTSTMAPYSFASTTQTAYGSTAAGGSTSSANKVQFVINGTSTDTVVLDNLLMDGVTTNGTVGNTGLAGQWNYKGMTSITVGGVVTNYRVYDHSTTNAQVLVDSDVGTGASGNAVAVTNVQASGITTKQYTETFDAMEAFDSTTRIDYFTSTSGLLYAGQIGEQYFNISPEGTGLNGTGRALHVTSSAAVHQWAIDTTNFEQIQSMTFKYWGVDNSTGGVYFMKLNNAGHFGVNAVSSAGGQSTPFSMTANNGGTAFAAASFQGMPTGDYYIDDVKVTLGNVSETVVLGNNATTRYTTGKVMGTIAAPLSSGQYVEVFSNGTSMGQATVTGTSWSIADSSLVANTSGGEVYTAKIKNANGTDVTGSNSFAINQTAGAAPKLTITDDALTTVGTDRPVNYTFQFDQAVTGFTAADVLVSGGGVKGDLVEVIAGKTFVMTVTTPAATGTTVVNVADGSFTNAAGTVAGVGDTHTQDYATAATSVKIDLDNVVPSSADLSNRSGDDSVTAGGGTGVETILLGGGNDLLNVNGTNTLKLRNDPSTGNNANLDGGSGVDVFRLLDANIEVDLTLAATKLNLKDFETFDLTGSYANYNNALKVSLQEVLDFSSIADNPATAGVDEGKMLVVNGDAGDTLKLVGGANWTATTGLAGATLNNTYGSAYLFTAGHTYTQYSYSGATIFKDELITTSNL